MGEEAESQEREVSEISVGQALSDNQIKILKGLKDTELDLTIVVAEQEFMIGDLCALTPGNFLLFASQTSDPAWLKVNGKRFAFGDVVQIGEQYGFQVRDVKAGK